MAADETPGDRGGGVLAGLLAPLRLPERVLEALDELRPMRLELTRVREQTEPLAGLLPALQRVEKGLGARLDVVHEVLVALESDESHLNTTTKELCVELAALSNALAPVDDRLAGIERTIDGLASDVGAIQESLVGLKDDIQRVGLRGERGVIERARDAITGGHQAQDQPTSPAPESGSRGEPPP